MTTEAQRRPLRILHVGNIANNAYLNAGILNDAGYDCDVICYDYYHIMGCPEWEDAAFEGAIDDDFHPDWSAVDLGGFERPRWFAQGPLAACQAYLIARRSGDAAKADRLWRRLERARAWAGGPSTRGRRLLARGRSLLSRARRAAPALGRYGLAVLLWPVRKAHGALRRLLRLPGLAALREPIRRTRDAMQHLIRRPPPPAPAGAHGGLERLRRIFAESFPDRADQLQLEDLTQYATALNGWRKLFRHYDVVVGYATDGVLPLLCGHRPYLAYEHGTIRNIPFEATAQGRLCAATYRLADAALITNCDNIEAARALALDNYRFMPHPVNEKHLERDAAQSLRAALERELGTDFVVFHPARQHWDDERHPDWEKGNDILIRGFASFVRDTCPTAAAVFVEWGRMVAESKALLAELGVAERVKWIPPQPNRAMIRYVQAADVVADQFFLGAFGSLTPKALLHGCPVMLHLDEERHRWCLPEMPPVVSANTPDGVAAGLRRLFEEPAERDRLIRAGRAWYDRYHSNAVIARTFAEAIGQCVDG